MENIITNLATWATLILFLFYFVGRIITICVVKRLWHDKVVFSEINRDEYGIVDEIGDDTCECNVPFCAYLVSVEGMRNIKIYTSDLNNIEMGVRKDKLIYQRDFMNIDQAIKININTGDIFPTLFIEYETMDFMKVSLDWQDNLKSGVFSEMVVPQNTLRSVLYKLLR